jgi:Uma2 family endonuclease
VRLIATALRLGLSPAPRPPAATSHCSRGKFSTQEPRRCTSTRHAVAGGGYDAQVAITHPVLSPPEFAAAMERAGWRAPMELIDGEVVVIPPSGGDASLAQTEVVHRLGAWRATPAGSGRVLTDVFVRVGDGYLAPDAAWWAEGRQPRIGRGAIDTVPDLVVEVLSPATRDNDLGPKRDLYLRAGVREVWLIDPAERAVLVVDASGERRLRPDDALRSRTLLPDFTMPVDDLFA